MAINWEVVKTLHESGRTNKEIRESLNISRNSVQRIIRNIKNGIIRKENNNPQPIFKRLNLSPNEYTNYLRNLYDSGLSQSQIAKKFNVHTTTIENHFKKFRLKTRPYTECDLWQRKTCNLTALQKQALDGILLGDGHLESSSVSARITYGCKFKETLSDISKAFMQLHFSNPWISKTGYWHFKSSFYKDMKDIHNIWYCRTIKVVPDNLVLTPEACFWWFIGDGYQVDYGVCLCTDNFSLSDNRKLVKKLLNIGFYAHIVPSNNRIRIESKSAINFLNYISNGRNIPQQYKYKWRNHRRQRCQKQS